MLARLVRHADAYDDPGADVPFQEVTRHEDLIGEPVLPMTVGVRVVRLRGTPPFPLRLAQWLRLGSRREREAVGFPHRSVARYGTRERCACRGPVHPARLELALVTASRELHFTLSRRKSYATRASSSCGTIPGIERRQSCGGRAAALPGSRVQEGRSPGAAAARGFYLDCPIGRMNQALIPSMWVRRDQAAEPRPTLRGT